jgi:hypothetical protein
MKHGDDGDPVEQAFEAELFEVSAASNHCSAHL